jgi:tRNA-splicing ligase RtcB
VVNCHHNYSEEVDNGVWLSRKGAINADTDTMGIIPGSMGAATYIVRGKGNPDSYNSAPHGAGRMLSRGAAKRQLDLEEFKSQMSDRVWDDRNAEALLDEAPLAYKPIETVMEDSKDLVETVTVLKAFINYKGL